MCRECHRFARATKRDFVDLHTDYISPDTLRALQEWRTNKSQPIKVARYGFRRRRKKKMEKKKRIEKKMDSRRAKC